MQKKTSKILSILVIFFMMLGVVSVPGGAQHVLAASLPAAGFTGTTYSQNFDTLATSSTTNTWTDDTTPLIGWYAAKSVAPNNITTYRADAGTSNAGALYSYGTGTATERALGSAASGTPGTIYYGVQFTNNTGSTIGSLNISYTGEQWRNGGNIAAQTLAFHYQVGATSLITGTWTSVTTLDFVTPIVGATAVALDGNATANRIAKSGSITGLSVAPGATIWLRWMDINDSGNDHGVSIDDLTVTAVAAGSALSINDVTQVEGNSGTSTFAFTVSLSSPAPAGGVTFNIATADGTATTADSDYVGQSLTGETIAEGASTYTFNVTVNGDTNVESTEAFAVNVTNVTGVPVTDGTSVGTITNDDAVVPALSINDATVTEGDAGTMTATFTVSLSSPALAGGVTFDIATANGTATTADNDYVAKSLTSQTIAASSSTYTFDVTVNGDTNVESNETFAVNVTNVSGATVNDGSGTGTISNDDFTITYIHDIQGSGSAVVAGTFTVDAIVVGDYQTQGSGQLRGFFIQEEDVDADADPATSEGIFVFCSACPTAVSVRDKVRVTGTSSENFGMSQLSATTAGSVIVLSSGNTLPTPATLQLPVPGVPAGDLVAATTVINAYYEPFEGMLVTFPDTLSVSEYFELARYGQVILSEGGRPHTFTAVNTPTAAGFINHEIDLAKRTIILDDTDNRQNRPSDVPNTAYYYPVPGLSTSNYFRGGDTVANLTGVLHWSFAGQTGTDAWRIRPVTEAYSYAFTPVNTRPSVPSVSGRLKVASFNVLNYFLTIDTSNVCAPTQNQDCRGADSVQEFERQRAKMLAALSAIDADVFGFMEMENTTGVEPLVDIVAGLPGYGYINTGVVGGDAIRVGIIYKTSTVQPVGSYAIIDSAEYPGFDISKNRPALAQTFEEIATGERFTVSVNHLKSKGSSCGVGDDDTTTGQGNCNLTRTLAAQALAAWLASDPTGSGDPDFLIIGDLNSNAMEDPIMALKGAGYTDLVNRFGGAEAYGYVFDGQLGYLDHALANPILNRQVAGLAEWHINADEIPLFDYNDDIRSADEAAFDEESDVLPLYEANPYRTSDHDPIIVGLNLDSSAPPSAFVKYSPPTNGATGVSTSPLLNWQTAINADGYQYCIDTSDNGTCDTGWVDRGSNKSVVLIGLATNTTYYWQVRAYHNGGLTQADGGVWWSFTTTACYTLTKSGNPSGSVSASPAPNCTGGMYLSGTVVQLTPVPAAGHVFVNWSGDLSGSANPASLTMDANKFVTANFNAPPSSFIKYAPGNGASNMTINPVLSWQTSAGASTYEYCIDTSNDTVCDTGWVSRGSLRSVGLSGLTGNTTYYWQAHAVNGDGTVEANSGTWWSFTTLACYTLTTNGSPSGNVFASPATNCPGGKYTAGTVVQLSPRPAYGYTFSTWSGDLTGSANPGSVTMDADKSVTANYIAPPTPFSKYNQANGATGVSINPLLNWGTSINATSYEYCIDTSNDTVCDTGWVSRGAFKSVGLSGLLPTTTYYWQARTVNGIATVNANGGTWWSFTTAP